MTGDERTRYCSRCQQQVFNLSALGQEEAEALIIEKQGQLCIRYYQRPDGMVMFDDCCLKHVRALKRGVVLTLVLALALLAAWFGWARFGAAPQDGRRRLRYQEPFRAVFEWLDPSPPREFVGR